MLTQEGKTRAKGYLKNTLMIHEVVEDKCDTKLYKENKYTAAAIAPAPPAPLFCFGSFPSSQKGFSSSNVAAFRVSSSKEQLSLCALFRHFLASAKALKTKINTFFNQYILLICNLSLFILTY